MQPGRDWNMARSSRAIWLGPSSPILTPQWEPITLMLVWLITPMRRLSKALVKKAAKVLMKAMVLSLQETPIPDQSPLSTVNCLVS